MLAGLLFANADADDRPEKLVATLPFGGATLIEFQARLLIAAGAAQIIIAVTRATPELVGAVNRISRRGLPVDMVRTAGEALEKVHPLATLIVLADGLITSEATVERMAVQDGDAVLVTDEAGASPGFERIDSNAFWAGISRIGPRRLADAARLPDEYDLQSTLLRSAAQAGAARMALGDATADTGHGVESDSRRLAARGRGVLISRLAVRRAWIDRLLLAPLARWVLPPLVERGVPAAALTATGVVLGIVGCALVFLRWPGSGLTLAFGSAVAFDLGQALGWLRGEERHARVQAGAVIVVSAVACALLGWTISRDSAMATGLLAAITLLVAGALVERAGSAIRRGWWGSPAAYLLLLAIAAIAGKPLVGLLLAAAYAAASLADAVERLRDKP